MKRWIKEWYGVFTFFGCIAMLAAIALFAGESLDGYRAAVKSCVEGSDDARRFSVDCMRHGGFRSTCEGNAYDVFCKKKS